MSTTPEGKVKERVKKILREHGAYYFMPVQAGYGMPGLDFHCCFEGRAFCVEAKAPGKHATPRQQLTIEEMEKSGMRIFIVGERQNESYYSGEAELESWLLGLTY